MMNEKGDELLSRGVAALYPSREFIESRIARGEKLTIYLGIDPTGPMLHLGHAIPLKKLGEFQKAGHKIILLMGDFTAMIGDPTDKSATRTQLTHKEVLTNLKLYKKQASAFLSFSGKNAAQFKFNSKWLGSMKFAEVLSLASNMTVQQMLERDMFKKRMRFTVECPNCHEINLWLHAHELESGEYESEERGPGITTSRVICKKCNHEFNPSDPSEFIKVFSPKPIFIHEFMYPLMQGYDSVAMDVDGEVGGNDQTFNMLCGRNLMKTLKNKEKFVLTMKLLEDNSGKKMGKTEGNMVALSDTPAEMYGKVMSWSDSLIIPGFELCTDVSMQEIETIARDLASNAVNPRDLKMKLAKAIAVLYHGEKKAEKAESEFVSTFQKNEIPEHIETVSVAHDTLLMDILTDKGIVLSKSEFRRLVDEHAISNLDLDEKVSSHTEIAKAGVYRIGKKRFCKIVII